MAKVNVSIPQGTRDFGPEVVRKRNFIFNTIRSVFEVYGFEPLETPAMENMETLMGKYGEEGDKLIFRILESGDSFKKEFFTALGELLKKRYELVEYHLKNLPGFENAENSFDKPLWEYNPEILEFFSGQILTEELKIINDDLKKRSEKIKLENLPALKYEISSKALKYDLTIPFARYVAMNHNKLTFPFKRYQIQPVWRADRPQKGRYREFYQCDADVVGSHSLLNEIELVNIYSTVFEKLKVNVEIKINSRKILTALAETCNAPDKLIDITVAIDKLDKIGIEKVKEELTQKGLNNQQTAIIEKYLGINGSNDEKTKQLKELLGNNKSGEDGIEALTYIVSASRLTTSGLPTGQAGSRLTIDFTLARGLNYYTGSIIEVKALNINMGSIGGGGRYDDLTGLFGVPDIPGVGISFGVDRIYDVMEELKVFPEAIYTGTQVLFFNLGEKEGDKAFELMQQLRNNNIRCELFHEPAKFDKQFKYAEKKNIPYAIIIGSKELDEKTCVIKDLRKGEQQSIAFDKIGEYSFS